MRIKTRAIDPLAEKFPRKKRGNSPFIAAIPLPWLLAALNAERPVSVTRVCLAYWFRRLTRNNPEVRLSNEFAADFDLTDSAKRRAVDVAINAGLLTLVERRPGRSPVVRLPDEWEAKL